VRVGGVARRSIWLADDGRTVEIIDQTRLPFEFVVARLAKLADAVEAIRTMQVRGAPLIGVTAAYGLCLALREDASDAALEGASEELLATRPTAGASGRPPSAWPWPTPGPLPSPTRMRRPAAASASMAST